MDWLPSFTEHGHNDTILKEHADVAQLVEQLIRNQQVVSSSLTVGSIQNTQAQVIIDFAASPSREAVAVWVSSRTTRFQNQALYLWDYKRVMDCAGNVVLSVLVALPEAGGVRVRLGCATIPARCALL